MFFSQWATHGETSFVTRLVFIFLQFPIAAFVWLKGSGFQVHKMHGTFADVFWLMLGPWWLSFDPRVYAAPHFCRFIVFCRRLFLKFGFGTVVCFFCIRNGR